MKLTITKNQVEKKGLLGGSKGFDFTLAFQALLTPDEKELIRKYKIGGQVLTSFMVGDNPPTFIRVDDLEKGHVSTVSDVTELLALKDKIVSACETLKVLLEVMASFGGTEVIEI